MSKMHYSWRQEYYFCLNILNRLLETEFILGNYPETEQAIGSILQHATCDRNTAPAHYTRLQMIVKQNDDDRDWPSERLPNS
jgi:hypothetical protein